MKRRKHLITSVVPGSIAHELGLANGDFLLSLNGKIISDLLDYRFQIQSEQLCVEVEKPDGEIWELDIEKDPEEDLGLMFAHPLMSPKRRCRNSCVFCFIDQQPPGLRPTLYIKDDDPRLSFLMGNYVTLTNMSVDEARRLASYHLSPLRISVHAADLALRREMMNSDAAGNLYETLEIFADAGIEMHFQAVICKEVNDGGHLDYTIETLASLPNAASLAIVPAGLTKHREGLYPLEHFTSQEALAIIKQVAAFQKKYRKTLGTAFVFAADEWYIMAGEPLPGCKHYEDFPQLDNGVGMLRLFERQFCQGISKIASQTHNDADKKAAPSIGIVTGQAAGQFMKNLAAKFQESYPQSNIRVYVVNNNFFGENITVSGLLTGGDIISQLQGQIDSDILFLPENAFRSGTKSKVMLDGTTLKKLSSALGVPVKIGSSDGRKFHRQLLDLMQGV